MTVYLAGDTVDDLGEETEGWKHKEPEGAFRALADIRSGYLSPRYVAIDKPAMWERVICSKLPSCRCPECLAYDESSPL